MTNSQCKRWCFTINNPTDVEIQAICDNAEGHEYLVFGRERGEEGTFHLQGFVILQTKLRLRQVKLLAGFRRGHFEVSRGTPQQAAAYCKKDGDYEEYGTLPSSQGKRTDFEELKEWIKNEEVAPSHRAIAEQFPSLWGRYQSACLSFLNLFGKKPQLVDGEFRDWQRVLNDIIEQPANDREINFVVDRQGNKGKSWLTKYWFSKRDDIQRLSVGKRDDLAFAIDVSKTMFVFDIPRGQSEYLQYGILEQLKDQMVFSPKYQSVTKILPQRPHVIVFMNEPPDLTKMSFDRFKITELN